MKFQFPSARLDFADRGETRDVKSLALCGADRVSRITDTVSPGVREPCEGDNDHVSRSG